MFSAKSLSASAKYFVRYTLTQYTGLCGPGSRAATLRYAEVTPANASCRVLHIFTTCQESDRTSGAEGCYKY